MKKSLKNTFLAVVAGFFVLALALTLGRTTLAQAIDGTALETQIGNLVSTLEKVFLQEKSSGGGSVITIAPPIPTMVVVNPTCLDNYTTWSHSHTYLPDAPWNIDFIPRENGSPDPFSPYINEQFVDLNGDGLADYIYKYANLQGNSYYSTSDQTCVYLNNGAGFDLVYRCVANVEYVSGNPPTVSSQNYYGDCADM